MPVKEPPLSTGLVVTRTGVRVDPSADAGALLFAAVRAQDAGKVGILLTAGADPNARRGGHTQLAAEMDRAGCVRRLLRDPRTAVDPPGPHGVSAVAVAVRSKSREALKALLADGRPDPNIPEQPHGNTPFLDACVRNLPEVVHIMLDFSHHVDIFCRDAKGESGYLVATTSVRMVLRERLGEDVCNRMLRTAGVPRGVAPPDRPATPSAPEQVGQDAVRGGQGQGWGTSVPGDTENVPPTAGTKRKADEATVPTEPYNRIAFRLPVAKG
ncbi:hypothetical protein DFJ74DRAFT_713217 [Hyaloraphidium curvatum]|nr:hypothetical protein DFJ74DRAFT_713217 [Hyaloraphidium curvatum]